MKKLKVLISAVLVLSIFSLCIVHAFAADENSISPEDKISPELAEKMAEADEDELIPVWIWYQDIDQDEVDSIVADQTGLSCDNISVQYKSMTPQDKYSLEMVSDDLNGEITNNDINEKIRNIVQLNSEERMQEKKNTDSFILLRRRVANALYDQKSKKILNELKISLKNVVFRSSLTSSIIVKANKKNIMYYSNNNSIIHLYYYNNQEFEPPLYENDKDSMRYDLALSQFGLTGDGINVLFVDHDYIRSDVNYFSDLSFPSRIKNIVYNSNTEQYGLFDVTNTTVLPNASSYHANICASVLQKYATNVYIFSTERSHYNEIEWAISNLNIKLISASVNYGTPISYNNSPDALWYDALIKNHSITVLAACGNNMSWNGGANAPHVISPACSYNTIGVGAYNSNSLGQDDDRMYDFRYTPLSNTNLPRNKPEVLVASDSTSKATPALAGIVSMMIQYKPSLAAQPELIKAILMASSHRKLEFTNNAISPENIANGLTERQGAGPIDVYRAMCITILENYRIGTLYDNNSTNIYHIMPDYKSNYNISMAWLNKNISVTGMPNDPTEFSYEWSHPQELSLSMNVDGTQFESDCENSCKQMIYCENLLRNHLYSVQVTKTSNDTNQTRYAVAWSTMNNKNKLSFVNLLGDTIVGKELEAIAFFRDGSEAPVAMLNYDWYRSFDGLSWESIGNHTNKYTLTTDDTQTYIRCSVTTKSDVSLSNSFEDTDERIILYGDADSDRVVSALDATKIQKFLVGLASLTDREKIASDVNGDGYVTIVDATLIQEYLAHIITQFPVEN